MGEWIASIFTTVLKTGWKLYLAALLAGIAFLFLPVSLIQQLGLEEARQTYRMYAGIAVVVSASLLSVNVISFLVNIVLQPWRDWRFRRLVRLTLADLTEEEKEFLRPYIFANANTISAPINDGIAGGLTAKKLVYRSSQVGYGLNFPYNLQPVVRKILADHPELLD